MTIVEKPLVELVQQLPPDSAAEVRHSIEFLLERQRGPRAARRALAPRAWSPGFFEATAGSLPDFPDVSRV